MKWLLITKYPKISHHDVIQFFELLTINAYFAPSIKNKVKICEDPNDDKFIYCALASKAHIIISGDAHLLNKNGYQNIEILKPADFIKKYL
jgi:putative PIN family toxin of toxin-antitoxin system